MGTPMDRERSGSGFISAVSHELRSPLNVVIGYTDLLREGAFGPLTEDQEDALRRIGDSAHLLLRRLGAVLEYSRIDAQEVELAAQDVSLAEVLLIASEQARTALAGRDGIAFTAQLDDHLPTITTDPEKLLIALNHLLDNAIKFTERGEVRLQATRLDGHIELEVHDTGIGIAAENLETIFAPFSKLDANAPKGFRDFGLGLFVARSYVELMGGEISVESRLGEGSTFRIRLPISPPAQ